MLREREGIVRPQAEPAPRDYVARDISKRFGGITALRSATIHLHAGQVHALVGENGAGKSTLVKILVGALAPDSGSLQIDGREVRFATTREAREAGIAIVFQELNLFPDLDVASNLVALQPPSLMGPLLSQRHRRDAAEMLDLFELPESLLGRKLGELALYHQQLIGIARAMVLRPKVLILDEPTSALNAMETGSVLRLIGRLRELGTLIVYVSHRLDDVLRISDVITVVRNGSTVATLEPQETSVSELVRLMIGREPPASVKRAPRVWRGKQLQVEGLSVAGGATGVSFHADAGEVVGLAGLEEAGFQDVLDVLFGLRRPSEGRMMFAGKPFAPRGTRDAVRLGVASIPIDRRSQGLMLQAGIADNLAHVVFGNASSAILHQRWFNDLASRWTDRFQIMHSGPDQPVIELSGGNQQKVLISKWLEIDPRLIIFHDPTRGVDTAAKSEILKIIREIADQGKTALFYSSDVSEYSNLCDRVLVFSRGRISDEFSSGNFDENSLIVAMNGGES